MGKTEDLAKLDRSVKDTEIRIRTVQTNIAGITKDIHNLTVLEKTLADNIVCLKKQQIVALAQEFKKVRDELHRTRFKITMLINNREDLSKAEDDMKNFLIYSRKELEKLKNSIDNNVIQVNFGRKNG